MSHSVQIVLIADQEIKILDRDVNIHDIKSIALDNEGIIREIHLKDKWEDVYAGYVIVDLTYCGHFVGPCSEMHRVALRQHASRFTKKQALNYIANNEGEYLIEDAV